MSLICLYYSFQYFDLTKKNMHDYMTGMGIHWMVSPQLPSLETRILIMLIHPRIDIH